MTMARSETSRAKCRFCSESRTETPSRFSETIARHLLDDHRRDALRRLVEQHAGRGLPISVRAIVSICCSPPDMRPPGRSRISPRLGKSAKSLSSASTSARPRAAAGADVEVLHDGEVGEDAPVLRHVAEAEPGDAVRRQPLDVAGRGTRSLALARPHQAHDGLHRRRLAGAVAAEQGHHLAAPTSSDDAVQDVRAAVAGVERSRAPGGLAVTRRSSIVRPRTRPPPR